MSLAQIVLKLTIQPITTEFVLLNWITRENESETKLRKYNFMFVIQMQALNRKLIQFDFFSRKVIGQCAFLLIFQAAD